MEDSNATCFESDAEVTFRENPALEQAAEDANIVMANNDDAKISTDSNADAGSMSDIQLQELPSTLTQTIV